MCTYHKSQLVGAGFAQAKTFRYAQDFQHGHRQMIGLIKDYFDEYLRFWTFLGAALLRPVEEISFRARRDTDLRNAALFLASALLTNAILFTLVAGESIGDMTRFAIFIIIAATLSFLGFLSFSLAWKVFRYKGDIRKLMRVGLYFNGIYQIIIGLSSVVFYGAFKLINPPLFKTYHAVMMGCEGGYFAKVERMNEIAASDPTISILSTILGGVIFVSLITYWIASLRLYLQLFPMPALKGFATLMFGIICSWASAPLGAFIGSAISQPVNGC